MLGMLCFLYRPASELTEDISVEVANIFADNIAIGKKEKI